MLEKKILDDAFTAEAFAGFLALENDKKYSVETSSELNRKLKEKLGAAQKMLIPLWFYGAAASLIISAGVIWAVFLNGQKAENRQLKKEVSAMEISEPSKSNEQEEEILSAAAPQSGNPQQPPTESKPENVPKAYSYKVENSIVTDRYKEETDFSETVPRQQQIQQDKRSRVASADRVMTEPDFSSGKMISRDDAALTGVPAVVHEDENGLTDSAHQFIIPGRSGDSVQDKKKMLAAAAPMAAGKRNSATSSPAYATIARPEKGWNNYQDYLEKNAGSAGIDAEVTVTFSVHADGTLSHFSANGNKQLQMRAIRIIRNGPAWLAVQPGGNDISQPVKITIHFTR